MSWERALARWWSQHAAERGLRSSTLALALVVVTRMDGTGAAWPGRDRVMREAAIGSTHTYYAALHEAVDHGLLIVERRGANRPNVFRAGPALLEAAKNATSAAMDAAHTATSERAGRCSLCTTDDAENGTRDVAVLAPRTKSRNDAKEGNHPPTPRTLNVPATHANDTDAASDRRRVDWEQWASLWNEIASEAGLPRVTPPARWPQSRKRALTQRLAEHGEAAVREVLKAPLESAFLRGEAGRDSWPGATFDWLLRPSNFVKVLERHYLDRPRQRQPWRGAARNEAWEDLPAGVWGLEEEVQ